MNEQVVYINLDDSGKLSRKEKISVYSGVVFISKKEKDKFITQYKSIVNSMKCKYCKEEKNICKNKCPEIKNYKIKESDKRRFLNYIKKYFTVSLVIKNDSIYDHIINSKASKGRYIDFTIKLLVKGIIVKLINNGKINPNKPVKIVLNIDEQTTKNNGYYNLKDGIVEELVHGISNFDYNKKFKKILYNDLEVIINYQNSANSYLIQAADILAGNVRKKCVNAINNNEEINNNLNFIDFKIFFP